ncbi:MAG: antA/AntB antirepressor family protein [Magnetococcales bacterium]|nr:antA/AntB antirepressor family protein [Magnetococcales bacterium]
MTSQGKTLILVDSERTLNGSPTVNARDLHGYLGVRRDFSNWLKGRIKKYHFVENEDYVLIRQNWRIKNEGRGGDRRSKDCLFTLDMAKELAMVENNAKGREARRYFIECERRMYELRNEETAKLKAQLQDLQPDPDDVTNAEVIPYESTATFPRTWISNGQAWVDSLEIAKSYGKTHGDIMARIRDLEGELDDFFEGNFHLRILERRTRNGALRKVPGYIINRDGFMMLASTFVGHKARNCMEFILLGFNDRMQQLEKAEAVRSKQLTEKRDEKAVDGMIKARCTPIYFPLPTADDNAIKRMLEALDHARREEKPVLIQDINGALVQHARQHTSN